MLPFFPPSTPYPRCLFSHDCWPFIAFLLSRLLSRLSDSITFRPVFASNCLAASSRALMYSAAPSDSLYCRRRSVLQVVISSPTVFFFLVHPDNYLWRQPFFSFLFPAFRGRRRQFYRLFWRLCGFRQSLVHPAFW